MNDLQALAVRFALGVLLAALSACSAMAQRVQLPGGTDPNWAPPALSPVPQPGATLGAPVWDPYSPTPAPGAFQTPTAPAPLSPAGPAGPAGVGTLYNSSEPFPAQTPSALFPNGVGVQPVGQAMRFLQAPRFRYAWLPGGGGADLQIHDFDSSLVFAWPNYLFSTQPLYIVPSFSLHLWDGPTDVPPPKMTDLPANAYSAFLDAGWESSPEATLGAELGARVGVFSDFTTLIDDSLRFQAKGLIRLRLTPTVQLRGGILWVDRVRIDLLPAGGVLWTPNPQTRFDIYFPSPKLSQYMTTIGNTELWWYVGAEYGGGSWTVKRSAYNLTEQMDINDIRLMTGVEWGQSRFFARGRRVGFFEVAWVTDRQVIYKKNIQDDLKLSDTLMIRTGLGY